MNTRSTRAILVLGVCLLAVLARATAVEAKRAAEPPPTIQAARDLLAALGTETLTCRGSVGPDSFAISGGALVRSFDACPADADALERIDALLGAQRTNEGRSVDLAGQFVSVWSAFLASFPARRIARCPSWELTGVIDAPTEESTARLVARGRPGKEYRRYEISAPECRGNGACAVRRASACAAGFGPDFLVDADPERGLVEIDPVWWLTHYTRSDRPRPFDPEHNYIHGYCHSIGSDPGVVFASIEHEGEPCCRWFENKVYIDGVFVPIDCGGGWMCIAYCMVPPG